MNIFGEFSRKQKATAETYATDERFDSKVLIKYPIMEQSSFREIKEQKGGLISFSEEAEIFLFS